MSMQSAQIKRSVQKFLQANNLTQSLHAFRNQNINKTQRIKGTSDKQIKQLICVNKKQAYHLHKLSSQQIDFSNPQSQDLIRQHFQKTDQKILERIIQRLKKNTNNKMLKKSQSQMNQASLNKLKNMRFFKRQVEIENQKYQHFRKEKQLKSQLNTLEESRQDEDEWDNHMDQGYQLHQFNNRQLNQVCRQLKAVRSHDYIQNIVKIVQYPEKHFRKIAQYKERNNLNIQDKFYSKLPPHARFHAQLQKKQDTNQKSLYPLECDNIIYDTYDLKIIYDRQKTGFEQKRDIKIVINQVLAGKYQIISNLGQAQFSNAIQVKDLTTNNRYCLKIIQNNKQYVDQSLDQIKLLKYIKQNCNTDQSCLLTLHDYFYHREHLMLLTQLLKDTLLHAYQSSQQFFRNLTNLQIITRQLLQGVSKLHQLHVIHTDLKPQNIMIKSYTNKQVKIIDLGSAVFTHDQPTFYISTRSYRAPEIILGLPYDQKIDIWSLGCIIAEVFIGNVLFNADSTPGILSLIQGLRGPWPSWMIQKGINVNQFFTKDMFIFDQIKDANGHQTGASKIFVPKMTNMKSRIKSNNKNFINFLSKCLKIDPSVRISAKEALQHPFITQTITQ